LRVVIFGGRGLQDYEALEDAMESARLILGIEPTVVLSGAEKTGVDALGERWAHERGIPVETYSPDWSRYPKTAGMIRNAHMGNRCDAGVGLMVRGGSPGSRNMASILARKKLPCWLVEVDAPPSVTGHL
jgi:hypothetical protein